MDTIRYFRLKNAGGFTAGIKVSYRDGKGDWVTRGPSGYADIRCGEERTQDLRDLGIAEGAHVRLIALVHFGKDNYANEEYVFSSGEGKTASYRLSGTTLISKLELLDCR